MKKVQSISRRSFIKSTGAGLLGLQAFPAVLRKVRPSDTIRLAHIGLGGMGNRHMEWFSSFPDVDIVALCDVDEIRLRKTYRTLQELKPGIKADTYSDFRRIIERKDIDAVTCATPDHWHALIAMQAFQAGKDVYGEKPLSYSLREAQVMKETLDRHGNIFQLGTQIHASENYRRIAEIIQSGILGKIHTVHLWKTGGSRGFGFPPVVNPPETLDWDMWLGPAPYSEYIPVKCHGTFRYFFDYSGGVFADFWCHIADILYFSLDPKELYSIEARGESPDDGIADTPRWIDVDFRFKDLDVFWTTTPPPFPRAAEWHIGAHFEGDRGSLTCTYRDRIINIDGEVMEDIPEVSRKIPRSPGHQRNFIDCVKSREPADSNLAYARKMTIPMHLALISFRLKRKLMWNSEKEMFEDDKAANYLLSREYRKPWSLF